jgi:putative transposase
MDYRRTFVPGGTYFFTIVTYQRRKIFTEECVVALLRQALRAVQVRNPFQVEAAVILPDHFHMIWRLPENDSDFPTRPVRLRSGMFQWRLIKSHFTHHWEVATDIPASSSRRIKGERAVWQRRYWEHLIRDEDDMRRHVEYIHYNPVKHRLVQAPVEWKYSSFHTYVKEGLYTVDWGNEASFEIVLDSRMIVGFRGVWAG